MTSLSISASLAGASSSPTTSSAPKLVETANGEYTADSVRKDAKDAAKLGLVKRADGNYGIGSGSPAASAAARSSAATQAALTTLTLGGS